MRLCSFRSLRATILLNTLRQGSRCRLRWAVHCADADGPRTADAVQIVGGARTREVSDHGELTNRDQYFLKSDLYSLGGPLTLVRSYTDVLARMQSILRESLEGKAVRDVHKNTPKINEHSLFPLLSK